MKNLKNFYLALVCWFSVAYVTGQPIQSTIPASWQVLENPDPTNKCATEAINQRLMHTDPQYRAEQEHNETIIQAVEAGEYPLPVSRDAILTIPVVVHIIHTGQAVGVGANISDAQVLSAIQGLNEDYRHQAGTNGDGDGVDCGIEFCLAQRDPNGNPTTGITRNDGSSVPNYATEGISSGSSPGVGANELAVKNLNRWPRDQYYNIWIVTEIDNNNGGAGIQGYAYYPTTSPVDGAVILFNAFGTTGTLKSYTNMNRTVTHEMGHAFNLFHTFQGNSCSESNCNLQGDRVCDTPPTVLNTNCYAPACSGQQQVHNYMDYTSQWCRNMFTQGQKDRMRAAIMGVRASLLTSMACVPPVTASAPVADFTVSDSDICQGTTVSFTDNSSNSPTSWSWEFTGGTPSISTSQNPTVTYNTPGTYKVKLTVANDSGNDVMTKLAYIQVNASSIWYADADGDGYGDPNTSVYACSQPVGYVSNNTDCNDNNAAVHSPHTYYADTDGDGYGDLNNPITTCSSTPPAGYVTNHTDCNDNNANEHPGQTWYADLDGDGYSSGNTQVSCTRPTGYYLASELTATSGDCNDNDPLVHASHTYYADVDGDGYGDPNNPITTCSSTPPAGYVTDNTDCNDNNSSAHSPHTYYADSDGDGYGDLNNPITTCSATPPAGYVTNHTDCNDNDASINPGLVWYADADGDGHGDPNDTVHACTQPVGYVSTGDDCNDSDSTDWHSCYDCLGVMNGAAYFDDCGVCDADPTDDCDPCANFLVVVSNIQNVSCAGGSDGAATVTASGGTPLYTIHWSQDSTYSFPTATNLSAGQHSVTVTDQSGCSKTVTFTISEPAPLDLSGYTSTDASCPNGNDGTLTMHVHGGTSPYTINWNGLTTANDSVATGLAAGDYPVSVTDAHGCSLSITATVNQADCPPIPTTQLRDGLCEQHYFDLTSNLVALPVNGALAYEWQFTDTSNGAAFLHQVSGGSTGINLSDVPGLTYGHGYSVRVRAQVAWGWGDFGSSCIIELRPNVPQTSLAPNWCGNQSVYPWDVLAALPVPNADNYRWQIVNEFSGDTLVVERGSNDNTLPASTIVPFPDETDYQVSIKAKVMGYWGNYGASCTIHSGNLTPNLLPPYCGTQENITDSIACESITPASQYKWEFTDMDSGDTVGVNTQGVYLPILNIPGVNLGKNYNVKIQAYVNGGWYAPGDMCGISVNPNLPEADIVNYQCGELNMQQNSILYDQQVSGATQYLFHFRKDSSDVTYLYFGRPGQDFLDLSTCPDLQQYTLYYVKSRAMVLGQWGPWGHECQMAINGLGVTGQDPEKFVQTTIYPNPGKGQTLEITANLNVNQNSQVAVYDATGKIMCTTEIQSTGDPFKGEIKFNKKLKPGVYFLHIQLKREPVVLRYVVI